MRTFLFILLLVGTFFGQRVETVGRGCCSAASPPTLEIAGSGGTLSVSGSGSPRGVAGGLFLGPSSGPLSLGNGGFLFLDPATVMGFVLFTTTPEGLWEAPLALPVPLTLEAITVQAIFVDTGMSIGVALSDAVSITY